MIKKYKKDIIELIIMCLLWVVPAIGASVDYRTITALVCFALVVISYFFIKRKGYALTASALLVIASCAVDRASIFTVSVPVILMYVNRYFLCEEKISKKIYNSINPFITGAVIMFILQAVLAFIETPAEFEFVWKTGTTYYVIALLFVVIIPLITSFKKNKLKKDELTVFRIICLCTCFGIVLTTYYHFIRNGFYNKELYTLRTFPWFLFEFAFFKGNNVYKVLVSEKVENALEKFAVKKSDCQ